MSMQGLQGAFQPQRAPDVSRPNQKESLAEFANETRWRLLRKIAEGGMGSVYLGEQLGEKGFSKTVAIKIIKRERLQDPNALQMFVDEAHLTADLVHANIAQVYHLGQHRGRYFIVMEYLHARTLTEYLKRFLVRGQLAPVEMCSFVVSRVCRGLAYAHTKRGRDGRALGIVHRDVTPSNVMMDFRGTVKLTDFGIAKAFKRTTPAEGRVLMGKFPYMSPEQAEGGTTDARSDLFSLGLILYELLTNTRVYTPRTRNTLIGLMRNYRIKDPRKIVAGLPDDLVEIVMTALQKDPAQRFPTAAAMGDALETHMYSKGYGPTNEKLARHLLELWPEVDRDKLG